MAGGAGAGIMPSMPGPKTIRLVAAGLAVITAAVLARGIYQIIPMGDPLPRSSSWES